MPFKVGVLLTGCGFYDGTDVSEAIFTLLALDKYDCQSVPIAPDYPQAMVVNHLTGEDRMETRNILEEAARLTNGGVLALSEANPDELDALIIPGGFGVTKNLTASSTLMAQLGQLVKGIYEAQKPLASVCLSPRVLAQTLLEIGIETELHRLNTKSTAESQLIAEEGVFDETHRIITSPCYTQDAPIALVYLGIENTVIKMTQLCRGRR
ncbi:MAG: isoprenoid biosynthesis glyoxalase ElbB [Microscillaceae bacterium]|nr:isoprenoid biosynthesis glyoxalase ElbB [Microscillaceae bacterium]